jgi:hypothetical protein
MNLSHRSRFIGALLVAVAMVGCSRGDPRAPAVHEQAVTPAATVVAAVSTPPAPAPQSGGVIRSPAFSALPGARADFGVHEGAAYRIEVPENWNGGLVMYAHGYRGDGPELSVSNPEIRRHLISNGYAWAASSYRMNGYRPDAGVEDTLSLRELFIQRFGRPRWTILNGTSMGGHVLTASLELHPGVYQGGLAACGALTGIGQIDYLAAFAAAAEYIGGVPLFGAPDARTFQRRVLSEWLPAVGFTGSPTEKGRAFQSVAKYLMGGDLPYWREGLAARMTQALNLLILADPNAVTTPAGRAVDTQGIHFRIDPGLGVSEADLNANARRFAPAPGARTAADNPVFAPLSGRLSAPVISLHTTGDAFVPFSVEQEYRRKTVAAGTSDLLVQRGIRRPNHCQFELGELTRAFDDLVAWIEQGTKPAGDDVLTADLGSLGLRWTAPLLPDDPAQR